MADAVAKAMHPIHNRTTVLVQRALFFVICNGQNSHEVTWAETTPHGFDPHRTVHPNPGREGSGSPNGTHVNRQEWDILP